MELYEPSHPTYGSAIFRARQIGVFTGSLLILAVTYAFSKLFQANFQITVCSRLDFHGLC